MSRFKLEFQLKQHTPIIHFQHDQAGATLRATEVKPKLDKFLIERFNREGVDYKKWLIGGQTQAFNYKLKIADNDKDPQRIEVSVMPSSIEQCMLSQKILLSILTFDLSLKVEIEKSLSLFFSLTNFGKRQSKGFGCFYPYDLNVSKFEKLLLENENRLFKYSKSLRSDPQEDTYFYNDVIFPKWSMLKSGLNRFWGSNPVYKKSAVFNYLEKKSFRWDKRWIKRKLKEAITSGGLPSNLKTRQYPPIDLDDTNDWSDSSPEAYRYGRALLGLAEHYEYQTEDESLKYQVKVVHDDVDRFQSPVIFKVFEKTIYAVSQEVNDQMYNTAFRFEVQMKRNGNSVGDPIPLQGELKTPDSSEFNLTQFLSNHLPGIGFNKINQKK